MTDANTQDAPTTPFLEHQKRVMESRAQQDRQIEERQKHSLVPAVDEKQTNSNGQYEIVTHDATNNVVERRTITPLPQPTQRFVRPETPSLEEIRQAINDLVADIKGAGIDYDTVAADLDSFYAPHKKLEQEISELRAALAQAEQELAELRSHGSPAEGYRSFIVEAEQKVSGFARQLIDRYSQDRARDKFDTDFSRLSPTTQKDLQVAIRIRLDRFANQFYPTLGKQLNATVDAVKARASRLIRDLQTILSENF